MHAKAASRPKPIEHRLLHPQAPDRSKPSKMPKMQLLAGGTKRDASLGKLTSDEIIKAKNI